MGIPYKFEDIWMFFIVFVSILKLVVSQYGVYGPHNIFPAPIIPMAVPMQLIPFLISVENSSVEKTSRPKNCPPCPPCLCKPSCTPSFFANCSPCHVKCRCRNPEDAPKPLPAGYSVPLPFVGPPPVVVVPIPPVPPRENQRPKYWSESFSDTSENDYDVSSDTDSSEYYYPSRRYRKRKRKRLYRRNRDSESKGSLKVRKNNDGDKFLNDLKNKGSNKNGKRRNKNRIENKIQKDRKIVKSKNRKNFESTVQRYNQMSHKGGLGEGPNSIVLKAPLSKFNNISMSLHVS